jgi:hypothetical protein
VTGEGCTSIATAIIYPNKIRFKLKIQETIEAHVVIVEAANMNCSRWRRRGWFFSSRRVRRGKKMSKASDINETLCTVEPDKMRGG